MVVTEILSRSWVISLAPVVSALLISSAAEAQTIRGVVVDDSTRQPLAGATVTLLDSRGAEVARPAVRSDSLGRFAIHASGSERFAVRVLRLGYTPMTSPVATLGGGEALSLTFNMSPISQRLSTVTVVERRRLNGNELPTDLGFDLRRSKPAGKFLDSLDLDVHKGDILSEAIANLVAVSVWMVNGGRGFDEVKMPLPGFDTRGRIKTCFPEIWIDGFDAGANAQARLRGLVGTDVFGVEVYSAFELPPASIAGFLGQGQAMTSRSNRCGLIVVWTKKYIDEMKKREGRDNNESPRTLKD